MISSVSQPKRVACAHTQKIQCYFQSSSPRCHKPKTAGMEVRGQSQLRSVPSAAGGVGEWWHLQTQRYLQQVVKYTYIRRRSNTVQKNWPGDIFQTSASVKQHLSIGIISQNYETRTHTVRQRKQGDTGAAPNHHPQLRFLLTDMYTACGGVDLATSGFVSAFTGGRGGGCTCSQPIYFTYKHVYLIWSTLLKLQTGLFFFRN